MFAAMPANALTTIAHILETDPDLRRISRALERQRRRLRKAVDPETAKLYRDLEITANVLAGALAEKAWKAGRVSGRRSK